MKVDVKKVGSFLRIAWNLFLAGRTVKIGGKPVKLPNLDKAATEVADGEA
jgi:hypothetical protein